MCPSPYPGGQRDYGYISPAPLLEASLWGAVSLSQSAKALPVSLPCRALTVAEEGHLPSWVHARKALESPAGPLNRVPLDMASLDPHPPWAGSSWIGPFWTGLYTLWSCLRNVHTHSPQTSPEDRDPFLGFSARRTDQLSLKRVPTSSPVRITPVSDLHPFLLHPRAKH